MIQNERRERKFDSKSRPRRFEVAREQDAADFFDQYRPEDIKPTLAAAGLDDSVPFG
jgi:hypothetical protein